MTLNITVGLLSDIDEEDEEVVHEEMHFLEEVNNALRERGLPEHHEPVEPPEGYEGWNATISSSDLEELLGLAVTVCNSNAEEASERFPHLVGTQCSYFLPVDLPEPLLFEIEEDEEEEPYDEEFNAEDEEEGDEELDEDEDYLIGVGSAVQLKNELETIAKVMDVPLDAFPVDFSGEAGADEWDGVFEELRRKGAKSAEVENAIRALVNLYHACQISLQYKMAVCLG